MDKADAMETDVLEENTMSRSFIFSNPSSISDPPELVNFDAAAEDVSNISPSNNTFTFATPTIVSQLGQVSNLDRYRPRINRTMSRPSVNMFAHALQSTEAFEQLRKNSRSHIPRHKIENSITCTNVPKTLLTKTAAKEYFTKHGNIAKITIRPRKHIIIVTYITKNEANIAHYKSGDYMGEKFQVEWTKSETSTKSPKTPTKKKDLCKNIVANLLNTNDDDVKSELAAMANLEYNLHTDKETKISDPSILPRKIRKTVGKVTSQHERLTSKLEKNTAKVEKIETDSQIIKPLSNTSIEELQNIIYQVALTTEDKYRVLEARDRLMRLKQVKPHSLAAAKVTSGTCPDMCPEKERLMRESQRQVAPYEQQESNEYRINHATAVKQYSRSSADQEEPMPHDLRPVKSLKMTMSYLLHEIADLCEEEDTNLAEWYHFLWDRTRGIRKDITQQELCCIDSVQLVEQCARFHIISSERLCAEDASVFDKKINSENLTKCLQTLKYMYYDLREKNITCKNEPEFRAYIVLLNLHNGNFIYDLQQLPKSIQNSPEVQCAVNIYFALESNNYYKFFKLVRETTYLNACILLRYFHQVRIKAFSVMVKAYCRTTSTAFPLYELMDILGFEDEDETNYFSEQMGLHLSNDKLHILLNRQNFSMPAINIQQRRACNLIESKRIILKCSIGQCIAGGKMPDKTYETHQPHNSFDIHGNLMPGSIDATDQSVDVSYVETDPYKFVEEEELKKIPKLTLARNKNQTTSNLAQVKLQSIDTYNEPNTFKSFSFSKSINPNISETLTSEAYTSADNKPKTENIFDNTFKSNVQFKTISDRQSNNKNVHATTYRENAMFGNKQLVTLSSNDIRVTNSSIFTKKPETSHNAELITSFAMATNKSIFSGAGSENIFMRNIVSSRASTDKYFSAQQSIDNNKTVDKITKQHNISPKQDQIQKDTISEAEKIRLEALEQAKKLRQIEEQSEKIYNSLYAEVIDELCSAIVREEIDRINLYDSLSNKITIDIINETTYEMCNIILTTEISHQEKLSAMLSRIKNRVIVKCFNAWKQYVLKKKRQRKALENTPVWLQKHSVEECAKMLYSKEQEIVIDNMRKKRCETQDVMTNTENLTPIEMITYVGIKENLRLLDINPSSNMFWKLVISWPDLSNKLVLWNYKKIINQYFYSNKFTVEPIILVYRSNPYETLHVCIRHFEGLISEHNLVGSDALLFIADASEEYTSVNKRLTKTVLSKHKLMPIPLTFIVLGDGQLENQNESIVSDLESLLESGYISEYTIKFEKKLTPKIILNLTQSAVLWLTINKSPSNPLEMDYLYNIYDICLLEELWLR